MSTPIWDSGEVSASIAATRCDRCGSRDRCVALFYDHNGIDLCLECFSDLTTQVYLKLLTAGGKPPPRPPPILDVDFIARLADAWDGRGAWTLNPYVEHRALLDIAGLPPGRCKEGWANFTGEERQRLLLASRRAIEFGRQCAWVLGEGQGARF